MTDQEQIDEIKRLREVQEIKRRRAEAELGISTDGPSSETEAPKIAAPPEDAGNWTDPAPPIGEYFPAVGAVGRLMGEGFRTGIEGTFGDDSYGDTFKRIHSENDHNADVFSKNHPIEDTAQKIGGTIAGSAMLGPGGSTALTRIGSNAALNYGDSYLRDAKSEEAEESARLAAGIQTGIEAVPYVGRVAAPVLRPVANAMEDAAAMRALKHMYGNVKKFWNSTKPEARIPLGKDALDTGIVRFGERVGKSAQRAEDVAGKSWDSVEEGFDKIGPIRGGDVADRIRRGSDKLLDIPGYDPIKDRLAKEADYYRYHKLAEDEFGPRQERYFLPEELQARKNKYIYKALDPMTGPLGQEGTNVVNQSIGKTIRGGAESAGVEGFADDYLMSGKAGKLARAGREMADRFTGNRGISLTDYIAGGIGGSIGSAVGGDYKDAAAGTVLMGMANRLMRGRGNSAAAAALYTAAKAIGSKPGQTIGILRGLETGAIGGPFGREAAAEIRRHISGLSSEEP